MNEIGFTSVISSIGYICILKPTDKHVTCKIMNCLGSITFSNPGLDTGQIWSAAEKAHTHYTPSAIFFFPSLEVMFKLFSIQVPQPSLGFPKRFSQPLQHGCERSGVTVIAAVIRT